MKKLSWVEYYEKFYDWAESTRAQSISALTSLGTGDEVAEIIFELQENKAASDRLLRKAVSAKVEFSVCDLIEFLNFNDIQSAKAAVYNSANKFTAEDMEELYGEVDDDVIINICAKRKLPLPMELRKMEDESLEEEELYADDEQGDGFRKPKKTGLLGNLFAMIGASKGIDE